MTMGRFYIISIFLITGLGFHKASATGIERDNRVNWSADIFSQDNLNSIGLVVAGQDALLQCSATLIKGYKILTAAHCVKNFAYYDIEQEFFFWPHFTPQDHKQLLKDFPGQDLNVAFQSKAPVTARVAAVGNYTEECESSKDPKFNDYCTQQDWALLEIVSSRMDLPRGLEVRTLPKGKSKPQVFMAPQYSQDRWLKLDGTSETKYVINPSVDRNCRIRDLKGNLAHTDCAMDAVGSGSPLLYNHNNVWYVVGIASLGPGGIVSTTPGTVFVEEKYIFNSIDTVYTLSNNFIENLPAATLANLVRP